MEIRITKPQDGGGSYTTTVSSEDFISTGSRHTIGYIRSAKDPVHAGIVQFWRHAFKGKSRYNRNFRPKTPIYNTVIMIGTCPIAIEKTKSRYYINGKAENMATVCSALARLTYKSCFEKDPAVLLQGLYSSLSIPENVKYCIENRFPYFFYNNYERFECRMAVQLISDTEIAIEIADGVWGTLSIKQFDKMCNFYVQKQKRGKLKYLSVEKLYRLSMDKEPIESDIKVMTEFLKQNRMQDIVERRAIQLVNDLLTRHPNNLKAVYDGETLSDMYIHGKDFDWRLTNNKYKSGIQMVSTFIWQPDFIKEPVLDENGEETGEHINVQSGCSWKGPICIDNMAEGSPLGDQFAGRALALLNDRFTITIVNTISRYITAEPNKNRVEFDEV